MKYIELTMNKFAIVDDEDYEELSKYKWTAHKTDSGFYAKRTLPNTGSKKIFMHRQLMGIFDSKIKVDHRNRNSLDNRRENLRVATNCQNACNRTKTKKSLAKGVKKSKTGNRFEVEIRSNNKKKFVGSFKTLEEAVLAYDRAAIELHGDFAVTNADLYKQANSNYYEIVWPYKYPTKWLWKLFNIDSRLEHGEYHRASGDVVCDVCKQNYYSHPNYTESLNLICNGDLVHL